MARNRKYKCRCCKDYFTPDRRNRGRQHYCFESACRAASKKASQGKWVAGKGRGYFHGPDQVKRVQRWRELNPDYTRRKSGPSQKPLQDPLIPQPNTGKGVKVSLDFQALQDSYISQVSILIGLMAHLNGGPEETLQDSMDAAVQRYTRLGQRLLDQGFSIHRTLGGSHEHQTTAVPRTTASATPAVQLDRPAPGAR